MGESSRERLERCRAELSMLGDDAADGEEGAEDADRAEQRRAAREESRRGRCLLFARAVLRDYDGGRRLRTCAGRRAASAVRARGKTANTAHFAPRGFAWARACPCASHAPASQAWRACPTALVALPQRLRPWRCAVVRGSGSGRGRSLRLTTVAHDS